MLAKGLRLKNTLDFIFLAKKGFYLKEKILSVRWIIDPSQSERKFGIIIPKKVLKSAVLRSLMKRRLRSLIKKNISFFPASIKIFFQINQLGIKKVSIPFKLLLLDFEKIKKTIHDQFSK